MYEVRLWCNPGIGKYGEPKDVWITAPSSQEAEEAAKRYMVEDYGYIGALVMRVDEIEDGKASNDG
jgi:hypothetical protein